MGHGMTRNNRRITVARPTQMRKFATVPLKREPLTQRFSSACATVAVTVAAASVGALRLEGYALDMTLGCLPSAGAAR